MSGVDPAVQAGYRRAIARRGQQVTFRRVSGQAPNVATFQATVMAIVMDFTPTGPVMPVKREGDITQADRQIIVLDCDLEAEHFPLPVRKNDKVDVLGETLNVEKKLDQSTRSIAGATVLLAGGV